jgi:hypothetical protein
MDILDGMTDLPPQLLLIKHNLTERKERRRKNKQTIETLLIHSAL